MSKQKNILIPTTNAESWKVFLASDTHWKPEYSAQSAAESWEKVDGLPKEMVVAFNQHDSFKDSEMLLAIPEFKVELPGGNNPSQNDLLVITTNKKGLSVITVEAKVDESFDKIMKVWLQDASIGKEERLEYLLKTVNLESKEINHLRYQLFHRLASSIIMADKFHATNALMIIQSFQADDKKNHFSDYQDFLQAYGVSAEKETIQAITEVGNIQVYCLWVNSPASKKN